MTVYVVDSSVAVKWYVPETDSEKAARLLDEEVALHAPDLLPSEFGNTLWKKLRLGELTAAEVRSIARALPVVPLHYHSSLALLEASLEIANHTGRTVYDSMYVALAVALDGIVVTADARLLNALRKSHLAPYARLIGDL